jgi:hypothetical protein
MLAIFWLALLLPFSARALTGVDPLYINILVKDPSDLVKEKVQETISGSRLPGPLKGLASLGGSALASKVATSSMVAKNMGKKMPKKMTKNMKENGLTVNVESIFQEGTT